MAVATKPKPAEAAACPDPRARRGRRKKTEATVYTIIVTREADGHYSAYAPALNNCGSFGDTLPDCLLMTEEALWLYLDLHRRRGWPVAPDDPKVCVDMSDQREVMIYRLAIREPHPHA
jgi:predicted RNase H-like HicB family nuclease